MEVRPWRRHGQDRLYVNRIGTRDSVACYDCKTGRLTCTDDAYREQVLTALTPFLVRSTAPMATSVHGYPAAATPDLRQCDLLKNKPGAALDGKIGELAQSRWKQLLARLLGRAPSSWAVGRQGERITGARLNRLRGKGWCVLHSIPLASGADIDHVVIGPSGVFTINTKHHRGARIWVGDRVVIVNSTRANAYIPASIHEAERAGRLLTKLCGFPVTVRPVLAFVGAARVVVKAVDPGVLIAEGCSVDRTLVAMPPVLTGADVEVISAVARDGRAWLTA